MRTILYGGSFNPPHCGHVRAAGMVVHALHPDRLLVIPGRCPPHKRLAENSPSPEERLEMCRIAFSSIDCAEVSDIELRREGLSYTADTIRELREKYPVDDFFLVMGSDMFYSFSHWYRFDYILSEVTLVVLSREESERERLEDALEELNLLAPAAVQILPFDPLVISSSAIRRELKDGCIPELLNHEVYAFIQKKKLYQ